jgi:AAHS family 4-hydroxybenzoate transporter-like MFS transporter
VAIALIWLLPESIRFLSAQGKDIAAIDRILSKIAPEASSSMLTLRPAEGEQQLSGLPIVHLFTDGRALGTLLLWVPFFMNLLMLYFIINWLPALLRQTHMPASAGIIAVSIFSVGGILGSLAQGRMMDRWGRFAVLLTEFIVCLSLMSSLAYIDSFALMMATVFVLGFTVQGAQAGLNALSATFYPTSMRSTGVGWALGVGRVGSIVGPMLGGVMIGREWSLKQIFFAGAVPALLAAGAILLSRPLCKKVNPFASQVAPTPVPVTLGELEQQPL